MPGPNRRVQERSSECLEVKQEFGEADLEPRPGCSWALSVYIHESMYTAKYSLPTGTILMNSSRSMLKCGKGGETAIACQCVRTIHSEKSCFDFMPSSLFFNTTPLIYNSHKTVEHIMFYMLF
jgi:hypothetical protein